LVVPANATGSINVSCIITGTFPSLNASHYDDINSLWNQATGIFTVPIGGSGVWSVTLRIDIGGTGAVKDYGGIFLGKTTPPGTPSKVSSMAYCYSHALWTSHTGIERTITLADGDTLGFYAAYNTGTPPTPMVNVYGELKIEKIG